MAFIRDQESQLVFCLSWVGNSLKLNATELDKAESEKKKGER